MRKILNKEKIESETHLGLILPTMNGHNCELIGE